jgi:hypothetical protein
MVRVHPVPAPVLLLLVLGLLAGCGDGDDDDYHDVYLEDDDAPPACDVLTVTVDRAARELVAEVAVLDDGEAGATGVDLTLHVLAGGGRRVIDVLDATSGIDRLGNRLIGVAFDDDRPGRITDVWLSTITPDPLYSDPNAVLEVDVSDDVWVSTCSLSFDLRLPTEPICLLQAPVTGTETGGVVPVRVEIGDLEGDVASLTLWYSFDGGATLLPATLAGTSDGLLGEVVPCDLSHPAGDGVIDIPTWIGGALVSITVQWDSLFDGVGVAGVEVVDLFAFVQDCVDRPATGAPPCSQHDVLVRNP